MTGLNVVGRAPTVSGRGVQAGEVGTVETITLPDGTTATRNAQTKEWDTNDGWTHYQSGAAHLVASPTNNGSSALLVGNGDNNDSIIIQNLSETDAPLEAQVNSYWIGDTGDSVDMACYFRFQDDNNFLVISYNGRNEVQLNQMNAGSGSTLDQNGTSIDSPQSFTELRFRLWESSGTLFAEVEDDTDTLIGGTLSTTGHDITSGGGVGVGSSFFSSGRGDNGDCVTDTTEIYYP